MAIDCIQRLKEVLQAKDLCTTRHQQAMALAILVAPGVKQTQHHGGGDQYGYRQFGYQKKGYRRFRPYRPQLRDTPLVRAQLSGGHDGGGQEHGLAELHRIRVHKDRPPPV
ncbi:MAG: hypothetical protein WCG04_06055 [Alphaproteobacteria bacterium]